MASDINRRFQDSSRGRIVALLRAGVRSVDELARELSMTDNGVRQHLTVLERDGMIRQAGVRRGPGAGKPALLYEVHPDAEPLLSRAYAPVLAALIEVITEEMSPVAARKLLRETGRRIAASLGAGRATGTLAVRAQAAATVLTALGGDVHVEQRRGSAMIRGTACPLATASSRSPHICHAVETLVGEISGAKATECCDRTNRPRCCFELKNAS